MLFGMEESMSRHKALKKQIKKVAGETDLLGKIYKQESKEYDERCDLARKVFYEALEEYAEGEYSWEEMIKEVTKSLKALS